MSHTVLFTSAIWPEPTSSAAGVRTRFLIEAIRKLRPDWRVVMHASSKDTEFRGDLEQKLGVTCVQYLPNDESFDTFLRELQPSVVVFDRFMLEEQFGWRVRENAPRALRLLDTTDLHFLRWAREEQLHDPSSTFDFQSLEGEAKRDFFREMAAILRCDHSFVVSSFERDLLNGLPGFPAGRVSLLRWGVEASSSSNRVWEDRSHFVMIGNFRHPPNRDSVRFVKESLWPAVRARLPRAELHVYGAYPAKQDMDLNSEREGFLVRGPWPGDARELLSRYRLLLAPLRFGAGIKGKLLDAWAAGTPAVTSPIGAEGMLEVGAPFPGPVIQVNDLKAWSEACVGLYENQGDWEESRTQGQGALRSEYDPDAWAEAWIAKIESGLAQRAAGETQNWNWLSELLHQQEQSAAKSLSRYIEVKEKLRRTQEGH
jgi:glycosyltransferase involved in cell wall biosynthesis